MSAIGSIIPETMSMTLADGVRLDADVYRPPGKGPFPVLLMRQPYGRKIASTVVYAHPTWYAAQGYLVVIQDVRGTGTSEGDFTLFINEPKDGAESVAWAADLPDSNGMVGMYGFSYQGMTQLYALAAGTPNLKAAAPAMIGWNLRCDWAFEGGSLNFANSLGWGLQMAALQAKRAGDEAAFLELTAASANLPLREAVPALPEVAQRYAGYGFYRDWVEQSRNPDYWSARAPQSLLQNQSIDVPMLHVGGWYDTMLMGTLRGFQAMAERATAPQHLVVGPWGHLPWCRRAGAIDLGDEAASPIDRLQIAWFDHFLKSDPQSFVDGPTIHLFDLGQRTWRRFDRWPVPLTRDAYLDSQGLAAATDDDGRLVDQPLSAQSCDRIVHDPWRPVPTHGGHNAYPGAMQDRTAVDGRADVACYTTDPLDTKLVLAGEVTLELWIDADQPSFDIAAVLSVVDLSGTARNLTQGYSRQDDYSGDHPLTISLRATCATINPGQRLRLSLAGASFPGHPVNTGTGKWITEERLIDQMIITLSIHGGTDRPSRLLLPVVPDQ